MTVGGTNSLTAIAPFVDGGAGTDRVVFDDRASADVASYYTVGTLPAGTRLTLNTGNGNDAVRVGGLGLSLSAVGSPVVVNGQGGVNGLTVDDSGATDARGQYVVTPAEVRVQSGGTVLTSVGYSGFGSLAVDAGRASDAIFLYGTVAGTRTAVDGGAGNDQFVFGDPSGRSNGVQGDLTLVGRPGEVDYFSLYDYNETVGHTYHATADTLSRDGIAPIHFAGIYQFGVYGGRGNDTYYFDRTAAGAPFYVADAGGRDTLYAPNTANTWTATGADAGRLDAGSVYNSVGFSGVDGWVGGSGADTYVVPNGLSISGWLDGRAGIDTLDYGRWTTDVVVNLVTSTATGVAQGVYNMQNVVGGSGNEVLVGNGDGSNALAGGDGRDVLIGGGAAVLNGGAGYDLLIAGSTKYEADAASLTAIHNVWVGGGDYATRAAKLRAGTGVPRLDASTVTASRSSVILVGEADTDLFFAELGSASIPDRAAAETVVGLN